MHGYYLLTHTQSWLDGSYMDNIPVQRKSKVIKPIEQLDVSSSYFHRFIYVCSVYFFDLNNTSIRLVFSLDRSSRYAPKLPLFTMVSNSHTASGVLNRDVF